MTAIVRRKSKLNGNEVSLSWRAMPSLVPRHPPKSVREGLGMRLCHASATPQLLTYGQTMRRAVRAPVFVLQATKGWVRLQLNAVCSKGDSSPLSRCSPWSADPLIHVFQTPGVTWESQTSSRFLRIIQVVSAIPSDLCCFFLHLNHASLACTYRKKEVKRQFACFNNMLVWYFSDAF